MSRNTHATAFVRRANSICYDEIREYVEACSQADGPAQLFALLDPPNIVGIAFRSCTQMAELVTDEATAIISRYRSSVDRRKIAAMRPDSGDREEIERTFRECCGLLARPLDILAYTVSELARKYRSPFWSGVSRGWTAASKGAKYGGMVGGPLGSLAGMIVSLVFESNSIDTEIEADFSRLDNVFNLVLEAFGGAMENVIDTACNMVDAFGKELLS